MIWIQTGSWDFTRINFVHSMEIGLQERNETLYYINSRIQESTTRVDLRVLATAPMPTRWFWNNDAIGAFNARMQQITQTLGITFVDAFLPQLPCCDDIAQLGHNSNHYFMRHENLFAGESWKELLLWCVFAAIVFSEGLSSYLYI